MGYIQLKHRQALVNYSQVLTMVGGEDDKDDRKRYEEPKT